MFESIHEITHPFDSIVDSQKLNTFSRNEYDVASITRGVQFLPSLGLQEPELWQMARVDESGILNINQQSVTRVFEHQSVFPTGGLMSDSGHQEPEQLIRVAPGAYGSGGHSAETHPIDNAVVDDLTGMNRPETQMPQIMENNALSRAQERHTVSDRLDNTDDLNPTRVYRFKDDYLLQYDADTQVTLNLTSAEIDPYLQVIDLRTQQVIAADDDGGAGTNAQLVLDAQAGAQYLVRVTSYNAFEVGAYSLTTDVTSLNPSTPSNTPTQQPDTLRPSSPSPASFNRAAGYGLVDAAAAIAQVTGTTFTEVPDAAYSWNNNLVNAPEVWEQGYTGQDVVVAVIDSGVDYTHRDLDSAIWTNSGEIAGNGIDDDGNGYTDDVLGWDFVSNDNDPMDLNGHGTHVAGTIAAENDGSGITGVAYGAEIMPIRVLDSSGAGSSTDIAAGIRYAADNGADVINLSLGGNFYDPTLEAAVQYAAERGSVVVMASGNSGSSQPGYPAQFATQWGISVGAIAQTQTIASFSNFAGPNSNLYHVVAPGVGIVSTVPGDRYLSLDGTSMAAPHVSGVVALMLSANPNLSEDQVRDTIVSTTA